ncbi:MAG: ATP-dependent sacrificial sulfur transferase LarE [Candidatus Heimdallarchaeota archaeon]|nr:MAG: ATP-dependent sacrificial sulfur transferase LarE [Candidatus Heimdallarchaeota archaeon]
MESELKEKIHRALAPLKDKSGIVAFSGGVDSTVVARLFQKVCKKMELVTITSEWISSSEVEEAKTIAQNLNIPHEIIQISLGAETHLWENPPNRCFHCKLLVFSHLMDYAKRNGYNIVLDGTNESDIKGHRPGLKALEKLGVKSPLLEGKITKEEVRQIATHYKLPVARKPAMACLASRIPYGEEITLGKLNRVEKGERILRKFGFSNQLRLRDHNTIARIEINPKDFPILLEKNIIAQIVKELQVLGYSYVTLDLEGYRPSIPEIASE